MKSIAVVLIASSLALPNITVSTSSCTESSKPKQTPAITPVEEEKVAPAIPSSTPCTTLVVDATAAPKTTTLNVSPTTTPSAKEKVAPAIPTPTAAYSESVAPVATKPIENVAAATPKAPSYKSETVAAATPKAPSYKSETVAVASPKAPSYKSETVFPTEPKQDFETVEPLSVVPTPAGYEGIQEVADLKPTTVSPISYANVAPLAAVFGDATVANAQSSFDAIYSGAEHHGLSIFAAALLSILAL
jgi:hypothetical protein